MPFGLNRNLVCPFVNKVAVLFFPLLLPFFSLLKRSLACKQ
ncbi:hypothetical protein HMPREF9151_01426 [Hoylesella saccharolytica F0055]|uniref:Uncharacterized protein n=1 Tax=Hoylesella saccharolytica F0055 TaxID=1127699 RepID=L1N9L4_9BACT|nr:hypothetical protein HMPREF9151_01426 [Hoylesella saccharolytica F0055]